MGSYRLCHWCRYFNRRGFYKVRQKKKRPFSKGPYHDEAFPYSKCNYEELLLNNKKFPGEEKLISEIIEDLFVELYLLQGNWT